MQFNHTNGTLYLGDAVELLRAFPSECFDCLVTDPPYRVISGGNKSNASMSKSLGGNNGKIFEHNDTPHEAWLPEVYRVLKPGTHAYIMTNRLNLENMLRIARETGFHLSNLLFWEKNTVNTNRYYMLDREITVFFQKKPARTINNPGSKQGFPANNPRNKLHPTQKPIELMRHYIENSTQPGQLVLDPFAGSGTTALAAAQAGRAWVSIESDPAWYLAAVGRLTAGVAA